MVRASLLRRRQSPAFSLLLLLLLLLLLHRLVRLQARRAALAAGLQTWPWGGPGLSMRQFAP